MRARRPGGTEHRANSRGYSLGRVVYTHFGGIFLPMPFPPRWHSLRFLLRQHRANQRSACQWRDRRGWPQGRVGSRLVATRPSRRTRETRPMAGGCTLGGGAHIFCSRVRFSMRNAGFHRSKLGVAHDRSHVSAPSPGPSECLSVRCSVFELKFTLKLPSPGMPCAQKWPLDRHRTAWPLAAGRQDAGTRRWGKRRPGPSVRAMARRGACCPAHSAAPRIGSYEEEYVIR